MSRTQKSSLKIYLIIVSLVVVSTVLMINFTVLPRLEETLAEISPVEIESIKNRIFGLTIGVLIFTSLFNFYFWRIDNKLTKEEMETITALKINPQDPLAQEKLKQIKRKRRYYITIAEPIFMIIIGVAIGFIAASLLKPLYTFLGTFK